MHLSLNIFFELLNLYNLTHVNSPTYIYRKALDLRISSSFTDSFVIYFILCFLWSLLNKLFFFSRNSLARLLPFSFFHPKWPSFLYKHRSYSSNLLLYCLNTNLLSLPWHFPPCNHPGAISCLDNLDFCRQLLPFKTFLASSFLQILSELTHLQEKSQICGKPFAECSSCSLDTIALSPAYQASMRNYLSINGSAPKRYTFYFHLLSSAPPHFPSTYYNFINFPFFTIVPVVFKSAAVLTLKNIKSF